MPKKFEENLNYQIFGIIQPMGVKLGVLEIEVNRLEQISSVSKARSHGKTPTSGPCGCTMLSNAS